MGQNFIVHHFLQIEKSTKSCEQVVPTIYYIGLKWPGSEGDHSPPFSAKVKNVWSYISTVMTWCSVKAQGKFYL
jgi:hypothetical protein